MTVYEVIANATSPTMGEFAAIVQAETETAYEAAAVVEGLWERFPNHRLRVWAVRPVRAQVAWDFWEKTAGIKGRILMTLHLANGTTGEPRIMNYIDRQDIMNLLGLPPRKGSLAH
jgi:hypothetical protein